MSAIGITEILVIAGMLILPCLGILVVGGIVVVIVLLVRKNRNKSACKPQDPPICLKIKPLCSPVSRPVAQQV